ncbi:MAG: hypothetical protein IJ639_02625 [Ruminococcus sp.]|nr:hypothetical protein [Ruminococcus sp.]
MDQHTEKGNQQTDVSQNHSPTFANLYHINVSGTVVRLSFNGTRPLSSQLANVFSTIIG